MGAVLDVNSSQFFPQKTFSPHLVHIQIKKKNTNVFLFGESLVLTNYPEVSYLHTGEKERLQGQKKSPHFLYFTFRLQLFLSPHDWDRRDTKMFPFFLFFHTRDNSQRGFQAVASERESK